MSAAVNAPRTDKPLQPLFERQVMDDAMSPEFPKGCVAIFSTQEGAPRPNDGVLPADADENLHFRIYQATRPPHWQAVALNPAWPPLDSRKHGLRVLAICMGMQGRRASLARTQA